MTSTTATAVADLRHITTSWPALREQLTTSTPATWPPVMGIAHLERDEADLAEAAAEYAERTATAPGERPAPLRVPVLDVITALDDALCTLADEIASAIQRPAFTARIRSASPNDDVARSLALMAAKDSADKRRWRFNMAHRDGAVAAAWLACRLTSATGPFRPLTDDQRHQIARTAATARRRLDRAIGDHQDGEETALDLNCPCGGRLSATTGPTDFTIRCGQCGLICSGAALLDRLSAA
ncbi:hypothetical protein [Kitasatospora sp. NBC_01266]|uniref:hypothetical protein n=1 Tax=Kitasatospora sp. NBC_01266 TaxID=2903572 RepID=UPI002E370F39|nr:hypothetical protein [Kitasatospora sp. NBC_01266]